MGTLYNNSKYVTFYGFYGNSHTSSFKRFYDRWLRIVSDQLELKLVVHYMIFWQTSGVKWLNPMNKSTLFVVFGIKFWLQIVKTTHTNTQNELKFHKNVIVHNNIIKYFFIENNKCLFFLYNHRIYLALNKKNTAILLCDA